MLRRFCYLLAICTLTACTVPFSSPTTVTPTTAPTASKPTNEPGTEVSITPSATVENEPVSEDLRPLDDPELIDQADPAPRDQVALAEAFKNTGDLPEVARTEPFDVSVGDVQSFWVSDNINDTNYIVTATLRYIGKHVLMYVDQSVDVDDEDIERSAKEFDEKIYPRNRELFGEELSPGIDGDQRLTILNTPVRGAGGYFSSADGVVKAVNRFSNEREMFVIGIDSYPLGSEGYASTLAHEFQHMIEWNVARRSPSWFNEGMSTLAEDLNGYVNHGTASLALENPDIQLTTWSSDAAQTGEHYGTSQLFMRYFYEQYAGETGLADLIKGDAGNNLDVFVEVASRKRPDIKSFADLYADWAVANVLNDDSVADGRYAYTLLPGYARQREAKQSDQTTVSQFGTDYLGILKGPLKLSFDGSERVALTGAYAPDGHYMWWSNRGDDSVETLTRAFDLRDVQKATLQFSTWYEIEKDWDYGFVAVSTDNGETWTTLEGTTTTNEDPQGQNFGNGLTGVSGTPDVEPDKGIRAKWIEEEMDLSAFAGQQILLRFIVVNDAAYNATGMLIDNIRIPEINYTDNIEDGTGDWEAQGFVRVSGELKQEWVLRLIRTRQGETTVEPVPVDEQGRAEIELAAGERAVLVVIGGTPFTTEPASYSYTISKP